MFAAVCVGVVACVKFDPATFSDAPDAETIDAAVESGTDASANDVSPPTDGAAVETSVATTLPPSLCGLGESTLRFDPTTEVSSSGGFTVVPANSSPVSALTDDAPDTAAFVKRSGDSYGIIRFAHKPFLAPVGAKITRVSLRARAARSTTVGGPYSGVQLVIWSKSHNDGYSDGLHPHGPTFEVQDYTLTEEPFAKRPWELTDIADIELQAGLLPNGANDAILTRLWLEVCLQ